MECPKQNSLTDTLKTLETEIEKLALHKSIPGLPDNIKELIVKLSPWFAVISMVMLLPLILAVFGLSLAGIALPSQYVNGTPYTMGLVFSFGMIILELMALPGLFKREQRAWRLMFYSTLLSLVQQILRFNLGGLLIGGVISFYFLFQVKSKYTK